MGMLRNVKEVLNRNNLLMISSSSWDMSSVDDIVVCLVIVMDMWVGILMDLVMFFEGVVQVKEM